ncbi:MAG: hypothetical protein HOK35_15925 [Cytophagia bacterium]|jgi:hypothetical protein|nr:hypothetical protein [Cytophagia bacterium]
MHITQSKFLSILFYPVLKYFENLGRKDPKKLTKIRYWLRFRKLLDLKNPKDLNEKILWLKFNTVIESWSRLSDKYAVRDYIIECGLKEILNDLYAKWETVEDINITNLPNSFVLKPNNGSGGVIIVKDKNKFDLEHAKKQLLKKMNNRVGLLGAEIQYYSIRPCIIAEKYLCPSVNQNSITDYKFWCFNGEPYNVFICHNRFKKYVHISLYDLDWEKHPERLIFNKMDRNGSDYDIERPVSYEKMLDICRIVSKPFPCVRVDLYEIDGQPIFGEMTFTSLGGMMDYFSPEYLEKMGNEIKLPTKI